VLLPPLALVSVLEDAGVLDFQLVQTGERQLRLTIGAHHAEHDGHRAKLALRDYLDRQGLAGVRLLMRRGTTHHAGRSGKLQRVVSRCDR